MDEIFLEQYKKIYLKQKISDGDLQKSWDDLRQILPARDHPLRNTFIHYRYLFAGIILFLLIGTAGLAQASKSGEILYPVKILTNNVAAKIFGKPQITEKKLEKNVITLPTTTPIPTEKEIKEDQKELKQEKKEIKEQNETGDNKSKENAESQDSEVKGARVDNLKNDNLPGNENSELKNRNGEEHRQSNENKESKSNNGESNDEKNKNESD